MKLKIKAMSPKIGRDIPYPYYASAGAAAMDLHACIDEAVTIPAGSKCVLTLANGKQYELESVSGGTAVLQNMDVQMDRVYQSYQRFAYYNIKKSVLKKLKKGIARIEFQMQPRSYAASFDADSLGALLLNSREVIDTTFGK